MYGIPAPVPVTTPVVPSTVAYEVLLLLQAPPVVRSLSETVDPTHTFPVPVMAEGSGFTVIPLVIRQPVGSVYVITVVPPMIPEVKPDAALMETKLGLLLTQLPPPAASVNPTDAPAQILDGPFIGPGKGLTVNEVVVKQVVGSV